MLHGIASLNTPGGISALLEQAALHGALYANRRDLAADVIAACGGGQILAWQWDDQAWPPSWAIIRQGQQLFIHTTGTVNIPQLTGDIVGIFAVPYAGYGCRRHSFFGGAWNTLKPLILSNLPTDWQTCVVTFVGHSMGAAVAFVGATDLVQSYPGTGFPWLGIAPPKSLTYGFTGLPPQPALIVVNNNDATPFLPANGLISALTLPGGIWAYGIPINWWHYGVPWRIGVGNQAQQLTAQQIQAPVTVQQLGATATDHPISSYQLSAERLWTANVGSGQDEAVVTLSQQIRALPGAQNLNVNVDLLTVVNIPEQNVDTFGGTPDGPVTPQNFATLQHTSGGITGAVAENAIFTGANGGSAMPVKVTFMYNEGIAAISDTWYLTTYGAPDGVPLSLIANYLNARFAISGAQLAINWIRISTVGVARQVVVIPPNALPSNTSQAGAYGGHGDAAQDADFAGTALLCRKLSGLRYSRFFLRGVPDSQISAGGQYIPSGAYRSAFTNFVNFLATNGWCWKGVPNPQPAQNAAQITAAVQNPDGTISFTLGGNLFNGLPNLSHAAVRIRGQKSPSYLNGALTVVVTGPAACITLRTTPLVNFQAGGGQMVLPNTSGYLPITGMVVESVRKRGPGRPFGLYRGKSSVKRVG